MWLVLLACSGGSEAPEAAAPAPAPAVPAPSVPDPGVAAELDPALFARGLVATVDQPPGHVVAEQDLMLGAVPDFTPDPPTDRVALVGATVKEPVFAGEPVRLERLVHPADGRTGYDALVADGEHAVALTVPSYATTGLEAGCPVEVLAASDATHRPRVLSPAPLRVLGVDPAGEALAKVVVAAPARARGLDGGPVTLVAVPLSVWRTAEENHGEPQFEAPERPGPQIAVARRVLQPGIMIRSEDLTEVGGAGLEGLRYAVAWAQIATQPIYPGELPHPAAARGGGAGLCTAIPDGMRAVAVPAEGRGVARLGGGVRAGAGGRERARQPVRGVGGSAGAHRGDLRAARRRAGGGGGGGDAGAAVRGHGDGTALVPAFPSPALPCPAPAPPTPRQAQVPRERWPCDCTSVTSIEITRSSRSSAASTCCGRTRPSR
ncbi:MAG: hypothetical protein R3F59_25450 [Myxococcota bacterium]